MSASDRRHVVLIGGQRCGTTWLGEFLRAQPAVRSTTVTRPEPKFFLTDDDELRYSALFPDVGGPWWLDKSTTYLERADAAARASRCVPDALVLAVLRDPVERTYSNWRFSVVNGVEDLAFDDSLRPDAQARSMPTLSTSPFDSLRRGRYAELLRPWRAKFGDSLVVLQYERMVAAGGPVYLAERLASSGLPITDRGNLEPLNEATVGGEMSETARSWLVDYFREPNGELLDEAPTIDLDLWQR